MIFEGPIVMVASGFLYRQGFFEFVPMFTTICIGDLAADVGWYSLGYFFGEPFLKKHGHFFSVTPENFEKAKALFHKYHTKILLVSKMTLGLGMSLAVLMAAGASKVPFRMYIILNAIGEIVLVSILLILGYFFGNLYSLIDKGFKGLFLFGFVAFIAILTYGFANYMKKVAATKL